MWHHYPVIGKLIVLIGIAAVLVSCDKASDSDGSKGTADSNPRSRRLERPPLESQGTRGKLRAALDAAKAMDASEEREKAIAEVGRDALESAPDITAEAIRELPPENPVAAELIQTCVANLMKRSPEEASAWADSLQDDPWMTMAREQMAVSLAESEPERAIRLLAESDHASGGPGSAMDQVLQVWTGNAPGDAAAWVSRLPAGEPRSAGIKTVVSQWVQADPAAATSWVASLSNPDLRQESTRAMAESLQFLPSFLRDSMLQGADSGIRSEIESQIERQQPAPADEGTPEN